MFLVTLLSETVNERALVSMIEDLWGLPFLVAIYCLPENPNQWVYYVCLRFSALPRLDPKMPLVCRLWPLLSCRTRIRTRSKLGGARETPVRWQAVL